MCVCLIKTLVSHLINFTEKSQMWCTGRGSHGDGITIKIDDEDDTDVDDEDMDTNDEDEAGDAAHGRYLALRLRSPPHSEPGQVTILTNQMTVFTFLTNPRSSSCGLARRLATDTCTWSRPASGARGPGSPAPEGYSMQSGLKKSTAFQRPNMDAQRAALVAAAAP